MSKEATQNMIGTILNGQHERDAIHIAVMPVIAGEDKLRPGEGIAIIYGTPNTVRRRPLYYGGSHGIVDPFLDDMEALNKGDQFWMFLMPNTITNLRHSWICPNIDNRPGMSNEHEQWLRGFADQWNFDYDELITTASAPPPTEVDDDMIGHSIVARGIDLHSAKDLGEDHDLFWHHLQILTGMTFDDRHRKKFIWSCTC